MTLLEALRAASAEEICEALATIEAEGRQGLQYDVGWHLYWADPVKVFPGPVPGAWHDDPAHGYVTVTAYDPARRSEAIAAIRKLRDRTVMEALAILKGIETKPIEFEFYGKTYGRQEAEETQSFLQAAGFTVEVSGFGALRNATSHTRHLQDVSRGAVAGV